MIDKSKFSDKERVVYDLIESNDRITQLGICKSIPFIGLHPEWEGYLPINKKESTLRNVRHIIRSMILNNDAPIIADRRGYYIPKTDEEIQAYIHRKEKTAKAQAKSHLVTYHQIVKIFGERAKSDYFDQQGEFF